MVKNGSPSRWVPLLIFSKNNATGFSTSLRLRWRVFPRVSSVRLQFDCMLRLRFITVSEPAGLLLRFYFDPPAAPFSIRFTVYPYHALLGHPKPLDYRVYNRFFCVDDSLFPIDKPDDLPSCW